MTIQKTFFVLFLVLSLASISQAKLKYSIAPEIASMSGTTEYEMDISQVFNFDPDAIVPIFGTYRLTSLLEFPLHTTIGGISASVRPEEDRDKWSLTLKYLKNLNDPTEKMLDSDWDGFSVLYPYTQFSYTESDAEMDMYIIDFEAVFRTIQKRIYHISVFAGGSYQRIYQDLKGIDGWQRQFDDSTYSYYAPSYFDAFENEVVGTYEIKLKQFKVGLQTDLYLSPYFTTKFRLAFAPAKFNDLDDHVLRFKESTSKGDGNGIILGLKLQYHLPFNKLSYLELSGTINSFSGNGPQTQYWYGDDPGSEEDDTGIKYEGLPHKIRTKQSTISLLAHFEF